MKKREAQKLMSEARRRIQERVASRVDRDCRFSGAVAYEGFEGGYMAALSDCQLLLNDVLPSRNGWWGETQ